MRTLPRFFEKDISKEKSDHGGEMMDWYENNTRKENKSRQESFRLEDTITTNQSELNQPKHCIFNLAIVACILRIVKWCSD
jgi:hypothetical protein